MDEKENDKPAIIQLYIYSIMSGREGPALAELDKRIAEFKCVDPAQWDPSTNDRKLWDEYLDCCHDSTIYSRMRDAIRAKEYASVGEVPDDLPEVKKLMADYTILAESTYFNE